MLLQDPLIPIPVVGPADSSLLGILAWLLPSLLFLAGGGVVGKIYLARLKAFTDRERELWEQIKEQVDDQKKTIREQGERLKGQGERLATQAQVIATMAASHADNIASVKELAYKKIEEQQQHAAEARVEANARIEELEQGVARERRANADVRALFDAMQRQLTRCQENEVRQAAKLAELEARLSGNGM